MKIALMGFAGSGKTFLAKYLSEKLNIPVMHLDEVKYTKEWKPIPDEKVLPIVSDFLKKDDWIMDGNYTYLFQKERLDAADKIILLLLPPIPCLLRCIRRRKDRRAEGYTNDTNLWFIQFVLFEGRSKERRKNYSRIQEIYQDKVICLRSQKEIDRFIQSVEENGLSLPPSIE